MIQNYSKDVILIYTEDAQLILQHEYSSAPSGKFHCYDVIFCVTFLRLKVMGEQ